MESHNSREKLVGVEAGSILDPAAKNPHFIAVPIRKWSARKCTNYLFFYLATALLVVVSYEIWQAVRGENLIKKLEAHDSLTMNEKQQISISEETGIQKMADELKTIQDTLDDIQKKIHHRDFTTAETLLPITTELPIATSSQPDSDDVEPRSFDIFPNLMSDQQEVDQDLDTSDKEINDSESSDESEGAWGWNLFYIFGGSPAEDGTTEEQDETASNEMKEVTWTEPDSASSSEAPPSYMQRVLSYPLGLPIKISWRWGSTNSEDQNSSESVESVEENFDRLQEPVTTETLVETTKIDSPENSDDYSVYYDSYEYLTRSKDDFDGTKKKDNKKSAQSISTGNSLEDVALQKPAAKSILDSAVGDEVSNIYETGSFETTASPENSHLWRLIFAGKVDDSKDFYGSGLLDDSLSQSPEFGAPPKVEEANESSATTETEKNFLGQDDPLLNSEIDYDNYQSLLEKRLAAAGFIGLFDDTYDGADEISFDPTSGHEYDDFSRSESTFSREYSDDEIPSYISKRSVDGVPPLEKPSKTLLAEQLARKMAAIQQAIDDENHLLQNEVSLSSESTEHRLQRNVDNFYMRMEAVAAHIDQLHERYLRSNELNDDYVSKELPSSEEEDAAQSAEN